MLPRSFLAQNHRVQSNWGAARRQTIVPHKCACDGPRRKQLRQRRPYSFLLLLQLPGQKSVPFEARGRLLDGGESESGSLGDVQQGILAVGKVQNPQHGKLADFRLRLAAEFPIEPTPAELRFALRIRIPVSMIALEKGEYFETLAERARQGLRGNEIQIVRRGVVLGEFSMGCPRQTAHRQIETWRTILPLVIPVRRKLANLMRFSRVIQQMQDCAVNFRVATPGFFVRKPSPVANTGEHQAVPNFRRNLFVPAQPSDRADRARDKQEAV